jgi:signal transduction histidine kinase
LDDTLDHQHALHHFGRSSRRWTGDSEPSMNTLLDREGWHPGAALALLLVDDIAAAHGGSLQIESQAERSQHFTTVRFTIPAGEPFDRTAHVG